MQVSVRLSSVALALCAAFTSCAAIAQASSPTSDLERIRSSPGYKAAVASLDKDHGRIVEEGIKLTEIPAPPFKEAARAKAYEKMFRDAGLADVRIDEEGNVLGIRKGARADGK